MSDLREKVIEYFKNKGVYDKYKNDESLNARVAKGMIMSYKPKSEEDKERFASWAAIRASGQTSDNWDTTTKKLNQYKSFIDTAEDIAGKKLVITTGGSSLNHRLAALDIGKSQLTDEQYDAIGKLAIDMGFRVGDEADHLHIDDTIRKQEAKAEEDVKKYYEQNPPKNSSLLPDLISRGTQMEIAARRKLTSKNDPEEKRIPTSRVFYNIGSEREGTYKPARAARKKLGTFEKYMSTIIPVEQVAKEENKIKLKDLVEQQKKLQGEF
jgi:hypothetical protein